MMIGALVAFYFLGVLLYAEEVGFSHGRVGAKADYLAVIWLCLLWPIWKAYDIGQKMGSKKKRES